MTKEFTKEIVEADLDDDVQTDHEQLDNAKWGLLSDLKKQIIDFKVAKSEKAKGKLVKNLLQWSHKKLQ